MFAKPPDEAQLRSFGFLPSDFDDELVEVWPENWASFRLFADLQTQWRVGFSGPYGLDYVAAHHEMSLLDLTQAEKRDRMDDLRVMEAAALEQMVEDRGN